jgi:hypothetical protein
LRKKNPVATVEASMTALIDFLVLVKMSVKELFHVLASCAVTAKSAGTFAPLTVKSVVKNWTKPRMSVTAVKNASNVHWKSPFIKQ